MAVELGGQVQILDQRLPLREFLEVAPLGAIAPAFQLVEMLRMGLATAVESIEIGLDRFDVLIAHQLADKAQMPFERAARGVSMGFGQGEDGPFTDEDDVRRWVRRVAEKGARGIKFFGADGSKLPDAQAAYEAANRTKNEYIGRVYDEDEDRERFEAGLIEEADEDLRRLGLEDQAGG